MKKYDIWYMRPDWFRDGIMGELPDVNNLEKTHIFLKSVEVPEGPGALEIVYRAMQGESWSPNGEARPLIEEKGLGHTSMSVGDVAVQDGRAYLVRAFGFDDIGTIMKGN